MSAVPARRRVRKATPRLPVLLDRRIEALDSVWGRPPWQRPFGSACGRRRPTTVRSSMEHGKGDDH
jgi:hypothetical protein